MSKITKTPALLNVEEYAAQMGVTKGRVRQWINEGRLPVVRENPYLILEGTPRPERQKVGRKVAPTRGKAAKTGKSEKKRK